MLPTLTVNRTFMREFVSADAPCFALGMVEERKRQCGFLALRPDKAIPPEVCDGGFCFGHTLVGNASFEVVQFVFEFYGFATYNALVNRNKSAGASGRDRDGGKRRLLLLCAQLERERNRVPLGNRAGKFGGAQEASFADPALPNNRRAVRKSGGVFHEEPGTGGDASALGVPG